MKNWYDHCTSFCTTAWHLQKTPPLTFRITLALFWLLTGWLLHLHHKGLQGIEGLQLLLLVLQVFLQQLSPLFDLLTIHLVGVLTCRRECQENFSTQIGIESATFCHCVTSSPESIYQLSLMRNMKGRTYRRLLTDRRMSWALWQTCWRRSAARPGSPAQGHM